MTSTPKRSANKARVLLGEITGAHGIRGEVIIRSYTAEPEGIAAYGPLHDQDRKKDFVIHVRRVTAKGTVASIEGVSDRTAAQALKGTKLYVDRSQLPPPEEGTYYHADLIGLSAFDPDGDLIGKVIAVANYGAGDILEIQLADSETKTELIPLLEAFVPEIDVDSGRIVVNMPITHDDD